jgi:hypothetical protein
LRSYIATKQRGAVGFAGAFVPKTQIGVLVRNLVVRAFAIPGLAKLGVGRDIADKLRLPDYSWPASIDSILPDHSPRVQDHERFR